MPHPSLTIVVFACVHNAGRSQMAAAFANRMTEPVGARATSAGTRPALHVHPEVVNVMREIGVDLSSARPQCLTPELVAGASHLVTMGCGESCPVLPGLVRHDWHVDDPGGQPIEPVRAIRDEIRVRVANFIEEQGLGKSPAR